MIIVIVIVLEEVKRLCIKDTYNVYMMTPHAHLK